MPALDRADKIEIAFAKGDKIQDLIFELPYTVILAYLSDLVPSKNRENPLDWIFDETIRNTDKFVSILEKIVGKIVKTNGYKKKSSDHEAFLKEVSKRKEFVKAYENLEEKYQLAREVLICGDHGSQTIRGNDD